jgi:hypothetical protein
MNSLAMLAAIAAQDLAPGQKTTISNGELSVTVKHRRDGAIDIKGNNRKSREALR